MSEPQNRLELLARALVPWTTGFGQVQVDDDERVEFLTSLLEALDLPVVNPPDYTPRPCPDCAADKHPICTTQTWDDLADQLAVCPCHAAGHAPLP